MDEEGRALEILEFARRQHPTTRAVLLTDGESHQLRRALEAGVDGLHERESGLEGLRAILAYLGSAAHDAPRVAYAGPRGDELRQAEASLTTALDALDDAEVQLARVGGPGVEEARRRLREAQRHVLHAHRAALEVETALHQRTRDA